MAEITVDSIIKGLEEYMELAVEYGISGIYGKFRSAASSPKIYSFFSTRK